MDIGERLREERERLGLSQTDFAALAGAGRKTQFNYESGDRFPDAGYLAAIGRVGADVRYVVTGERAGPPPLKPDEQLLLDRYRASPQPLRDAALRVLLGGNVPPPAGARQTVHVKAPGGQVTQTGSIINKARKK